MALVATMQWKRFVLGAAVCISVLYGYLGMISYTSQTPPIHRLPETLADRRHADLQQHRLHNLEGVDAPEHSFAVPQGMVYAACCLPSAVCRLPSATSHDTLRWGGFKTPSVRLRFDPAVPRTCCRTRRTLLAGKSQSKFPDGRTLSEAGAAGGSCGSSSSRATAATTQTQ